MTTLAHCFTLNNVNKRAFYILKMYSAMKNLPEAKVTRYSLQINYCIDYGLYLLRSSIVLNNFPFQVCP